jgi:DNA mismatch endonuclease (patch repair protein)
MDFLNSEERSERMSLVGQKNTLPEMIVRRLVCRMGYRYRLHRRDLPGTPDLTFSNLKKIIEVRGCFWHSHTCRKGRKVVTSRIDYWWPKLAKNAARDRANLRKLRHLGWKVLVVWECHTRNEATLSNRLERFLRD